MGQIVLSGQEIACHFFFVIQKMTQTFCDLTDAIFETIASGVPSKSQKSSICGRVRQTITLKSPSKGAPPQPPPEGYSAVTTLILDAVLKTKSCVPHWIFYFF